MQRENIGLLLGALGVFCFAGTLPMSRLAVQELDPYFVTFFRSSIASILAICVLAITRKPAPPRSEWGGYVIASIPIALAYPLMVAFGMQHVSSSHGGVILGTIPLVSAILSSIILKERLNKWFWFFSVVGAMLVIGFALRQTGDFKFQKGDYILTIAVLCASTAYVMSGKLARTRSGWEVISWVMIPLFPFTLIGTIYLFPSNFWDITKPTLYGLIYVSIISQYLGFFPWNIGLSMGGTARVSQVMLLQPFFILIFAYFFLGEQITSEMLIFLTAVVGVVIMAARQRGK